MRDLYDPDLESRFLATKKFARDRKRCLVWPRACWGSGNAWIIFVGPSPGAPRDAKHPWPGGPNRPADDHAEISLHACDINFGAGDSRGKRWMSLIDEFTGCRDYTTALTAVCNLDWSQHADQTLVPDEYLRDGCVVVDRIIKATRPRIVAAMTVPVWDHLLAFYGAKATEEVPYDGFLRSPRRLHLFDGFDTFLVKVRHPSRPIPRVEREAYRRFVAECIPRDA